MATVDTTGPRPLHPWDARKELEDFKELQRMAKEAREELPSIVRECRRAGLSMPEISRLCGYSRTRLYSIMEEHNPEENDDDRSQ